MFERLGVRLVLSSHDQSYERTYPLVDVPAANSPTTADRSCYQPGEGVVWLKASPGGKLSNVNWDFSQFLTLPPPAYTAVRTNHLHHFVELEFASDDSLWVKAWGVPDGGGTSLVVDEFRLSPAGCDPELRFDLPVLEKRLDFDSPPSTVRVQLSAGAGAFPVGINIQSTADWLTTVAVGAGQYVLALDPSGLTPGTYTAQVIATAAGYAPARLPAVLVVRGDTGAYSLQVSLTSDRSNAIALHGQTVAGDVYIFTTPDAPEIGQVRFFIDHQDYHRENSPPYDLVGSSGALALPYDSTLLSDGWHNVTAAVVAADGSTELASATFRIDNFPGPDLVAPEDVAIVGPTSLDLSTSYTFTATVSPISSTLPLTYTWTASGQNPETHSGAGLTDVFGVAFDAPGEQQVNVTVTNAAGLVFDTHPVTVNALQASVAPQIVQVDGPLSGAVAASYTFTATVAPVTTALPLTYTWTTAGLAPVVHLAGQNDLVSFSWDSPGVKEVSVTAANAFGLVSGKFVIQIVNLPQVHIALPLVIKSGP